MTLTLAQALDAASKHWEGRKGHDSMVTFSRRCVVLLGEDCKVSSLTATAGVDLLAKLRKEGLSAKTAGVYYGAFRRMLTLNGVSTVDWPKAPTPERKTREALSGDNIQALRDHLKGAGYDSTADLVALLRGTGLRCSVEALSRQSLTLQLGDGYDSLTVAGKGGHQRAIPVVDPVARELLRSEQRMEALRALPYRTHLRRWNAGIKALGITSKLPTPHAVRHSYAMEALRLSQGNLVMVQELLGHSDPKTTSAYLRVDLGDKARALMGDLTGG